MFFETLEDFFSLQFFSAPGLAWQAALKWIEIKLELLTDIDMQLMVEKEIRSVISHSNKLIDIQKLIINIWKITTKINNHHILNIET